MREAVKRLQLLSLHYSVNSLRVAGHDVSIIKGKFNIETAWGGDEYFVLMKQGDIWQLARRKESSGWDSTMTTVQPHTYDDTIQTVHFMVQKGSVVSKGVTDLYLLRTTRHLNKTAIDIVPVVFSLFKLARENDAFNVLYWQTVKEEASKKGYCSADLANVRELGLPWPGPPFPRGEDEITCQP